MKYRSPLFLKERGCEFQIVEGDQSWGSFFVSAFSLTVKARYTFSIQAADPRINKEMRPQGEVPNAQSMKMPKPAPTKTPATSSTPTLKNFPAKFWEVSS